MKNKTKPENGQSDPPAEKIAHEDKTLVQTRLVAESDIQNLYAAIDRLPDNFRDQLRRLPLRYCRPEDIGLTETVQGQLRLLRLSHREEGEEEGDGPIHLTAWGKDFVLKKISVIGDDSADPFDVVRARVDVLQLLAAFFADAALLNELINAEWNRRKVVGKSTNVL